MKKELELNKKLVDTGNKQYINVYYLMGHQVDYYKEIHDESKMKAKDIIKSRKYKVIIVMYNNQVLGYMDLYKGNRTLEIKDLYFIDEINNILDLNEVIYQLFYFTTKRNDDKIIVSIDDNNKYYKYLLNIGFSEIIK